MIVPVVICEENAQREGHLVLENKDHDLPVQQNCSLQSRLA